MGLEGDGRVGNGPSGSSAPVREETHLITTALYDIGARVPVDRFIGAQADDVRGIWRGIGNAFLGIGRFFGFGRPEKNDEPSQAAAANGDARPVVSVSVADAVNVLSMFVGDVASTLFDSRILVLLNTAPPVNIPAEVEIGDGVIGILRSVGWGYQGQDARLKFEFWEGRRRGDSFEMTNRAEFIGDVSGQNIAWNVSATDPSADGALLFQRYHFFFENILAAHVRQVGPEGRPMPMVSLGGGSSVLTAVGGASAAIGEQIEFANEAGEIRFSREDEIEMGSQAPSRSSYLSSGLIRLAPYNGFNEVTFRSAVATSPFARMVRTVR